MSVSLSFPSRYIGYQVNAYDTVCTDQGHHQTSTSEIDNPILPSLFFILPSINALLPLVFPSTFSPFLLFFPLDGAPRVKSQKIVLSYGRRLVIFSTSLRMSSTDLKLVLSPVSCNTCQILAICESNRMGPRYQTVNWFKLLQFSGQLTYLQTDI